MQTKEQMSKEIAAEILELKVRQNELIKTYGAFTDTWFDLINRAEGFMQAVKITEPIIINEPQPSQR